MTGYLLDTNLVSEVVRPMPDALVSHWLDSTDEHRQFLSVLTIGEIRKGLAMSSSKRDVLERWLARDLKERFRERVLPVDMAIAERWGFLDATSRRRGTPLAVVDGLLAATALEHGLTLVTRNVRDFERLGVEVINPWAG